MEKNELEADIMGTYEMKDYAAKAREAVGEGIVLLRNEGAVLPLGKEAKVAGFARQGKGRV